MNDRLEHSLLHHSAYSRLCSIRDAGYSLQIVLVALTTDSGHSRGVSDVNSTRAYAVLFGWAMSVSFRRECHVDDAI